MAAASSDRSIRGYISGCFEPLQSYRGQVISYLDPLCRSRVLNVGGNSNSNESNSLQYGLSYADANNDLSNSNDNRGSRVNFVDHQKITVIMTLPESRKQESIQSRLVTTNANVWMNNKGRFTMRTIKNVYGQIASMDSLRQSSMDACTPRRNKKEVALFQQDSEHLLGILQDDLRDHRFKPSDYNIYTKMEGGKARLIADKPLYPDRILDCAIANAIEDELNKRLIYQTHGSVKGHGTHTAMMDARKHLHNDNKLRYCFSGDIDQFFKTIPAIGVKSMLRDYIRDNELLSLMDLIIDSYNMTGNTGIALGGRFSHLLANLYLNGFNHHLKEDLHVHVMENYVDNYYIFGYSKPWLNGIKTDMVSQLGDLGLRFNDNWSIRPVDSRNGVDMVGWIVYSDHVLIRKKTKLRMIRTFKDVEWKIDHGMNLNDHDMGSVNSYLGSLKWFDSYNLC